MNTFAMLGYGNTVYSLPPTRLRASSTMTSTPCWACWVAATRPESPAPMITTSHDRSPMTVGPAVCADTAPASWADTGDAPNCVAAPAAAPARVTNLRRSSQPPLSFTADTDFVLCFICSSPHQMHLERPH